MRIILLFLTVLIPVSLRAQVVAAPNPKIDSIIKASHPNKPHHSHAKEHFLFFGANINYLNPIDNNTYYYTAFGFESFYQSVTNMQPLAGFQINYISYHKISPLVSYYNGEGFTYFDNEFNYYIVQGNTPPIPKYVSGTDSMIVNVNCSSFFIHYIIGFRFSLPDNFYINTALEPQLLVLSSQETKKTYNIAYDTTGHIISTSYPVSTIIPFVISVFNINGTIGLGYRISKASPHPVCFEFNFSPNLFNCDYLFQNREFGQLVFHRYTLELNMGIKL